MNDDVKEIVLYELRDLRKEVKNDYVEMRKEIKDDFIQVRKEIDSLSHFKSKTLGGVAVLMAIVKFIEYTVNK